jgi:aminoglycoside phosphotransferase (APT) family kinase protein
MSLVAVQALNERAGCRLELVGLVEQGQSGAAYVRWPDGRDAVVTTALTSMEHMQQTAEVLAAVKALGIPVPLHEFLLPLDDGTIAVVQERLPGATAPVADLATVDAIIAMNERFAGLLSDRPDIPTPSLSLGRPSDAIPFSSLETHSPRSRRLLRLIQKAGTDDDGQVVGNDLVHVDLTVPNMLFAPDGCISGVVDWNYGVARGDRHYGLVKLLHNLSFEAASSDLQDRPSPDALRRLDQVVAATIEPPTFRKYWAHQTLNMLYGSFRWGTEKAFVTYLELGENKLV